MEILTQGIGFLALIMFLVSYQIKSNKALYAFQLIGSILFAVQFLLLGAYSGCLSLLLNMLKNALLLKRKHWSWVRSYWVAAVLCLGFAAILCFTWAGPISILAFVASVVSTICYWTNNARTIRVGNLFLSSPCWLAYDIIVHSWGGALSEAFTIVSILVSIARFGWKDLGKVEE